MDRESLTRRSIPGGKAEVLLRHNQFDKDIFTAIFEQQEYGHIRFLQEPQVIIDAGANIGLATLYFAVRFPRARIFSIEPAPDNFEMLKLNTAAYENVTPILGAVMGSDGSGKLRDPGGSTLGYQVNGGAAGDVRCMTVATLCEEYGLDRISLLKMDIEGAEKEVFRTSDGWLDKVDTLVIELHERYVKGCNKTVFNAAQPRFDLEWIGGENYYFTRTGLAVPAVPQIFKQENPQKLPVEISWDYRDQYDNLHTELCREKDAQLDAIQKERDELSETFSRVCAEKDRILDAIQKERDELSETFGRVCAEKDEAIENERKQWELQVAELMSVCQAREEKILETQKSLTEYREKYGTPGLALKNGFKELFSRRAENGAQKKQRGKGQWVGLLAVLIALLSFMGVYFAEGIRREKPVAIETLLESAEPGSELIAAFEFHDEVDGYYLDCVIAKPGESCDSQTVFLELTDENGEVSFFRMDQVERSDWAEDIMHEPQFKMGGAGVSMPKETLRFGAQYTARLYRENGGVILFTPETWTFTTPTSGETDS